VELGGIEQVKQMVRDRRLGTWVESFCRDAHYGFRQLPQHPGFALTVVVTLALAIGANTAVFSLVNALMLERLPYPNPERIGTIFRNVQGTEAYDGPHGITGEQWEQLRDNVPSLISAVSSRGVSGANLQAGTHVDYVHAGRISAHYFDALGLRPVLGRNFTDTEDLPSGPKAVILSYALWHNIFQEDRGLVGQTIRLKGDAYVVVGVLPTGAATLLNADLYTAQPGRNGEGGGTNYEVIVRLRSGATWQQANGDTQDPGDRVNVRCRFDLANCLCESRRSYTRADHPSISGDGNKAGSGCSAKSGNEDGPARCCRPATDRNCNWGCGISRISVGAENDTVRCRSS
jgi:hypothetical protein